MTKRKVDGYEETLKDFVSSFHSSQLKNDKELIKELASSNKPFGEGYALGLSAALSKLKDAAEKNNIPLDQFGFESVSVRTMLDVARENRSD